MDKKNDLRLDGEYQGAFSKNQKRQRDERRGGNGGNDAGGKPAATGAYPEETVQTAGKTDNGFSRAIPKKREGKHQKENETEELLFPIGRACRRLSFSAFFLGRLGRLDFVGKNTATFNDSGVVTFHNRTSDDGMNFGLKIAFCKSQNRGFSTLNG